VLHVSQPTWTAQMKKLEDARLLRPFCGHRRMVRNLLSMPQRALHDLNTLHSTSGGWPLEWRGCGSSRYRVAPSNADQSSSVERAFVSDH